MVEICKDIFALYNTHIIQKAIYSCLDYFRSNSDILKIK